MFREFVVTSLWRAWLGFAGLTVLGFVAFLIFDHDNPLHSDDPYLVGFILGGIAAGISLVYSLAEKAFGNRWWATLCYGMVIGLWAILATMATANSPEGKEIGMVVGGASLVVGAIAWPLIAFRIPRSLAAILTISALAAMVMYGVVAVRLALAY